MSNKVEKIIIVGESLTGKTSLIHSFVRNDGKAPDLDPEEIVAPSENMNDFSIKILTVENEMGELEKVRLQLWDQGQSKDPASTFLPLFSRHTAGCIVVGSAMNLATLKK